MYPAYGWGLLLQKAQARLILHGRTLSSGSKLPALRLLITFSLQKLQNMESLSWWDYGNWIVYISKRPAVSNNFQTGVEDSAHFFITDSEQEAKAIMEKLKVKYVITDTLMANGKFGAIVLLAGKNIGDYYDIKTVNGKAGPQTVATAKKEFLNTEIYKLHELDGTNLGNLRLVHESNVPKAENSKNNTVKVFEYVPGARLSGTASPNQPVTATLESQIKYRSKIHISE